ncbi:flagellin [Methanocella sp. CWC-04]|uniref:Flagellin n=1 Tax=Methanooceanicella nereidis TaxID=2052831 RepID=A0AAP2RE66_9EURY|nr:archaellin/type IV pilin N-terminal domain-containing protein [Methanocella sp. CWC-04]MCD1296029.1 flagellin [Methanocella sp. CWC-04]
MKKNTSKFSKNDAAFTGLEAAIVLIAFVVVAAVFSYVMLGAGFFTSQKSKEVVHTGVSQATSSVELAGDVIGIGDADGGNCDYIKITLQLTAGNNPIDLSKTVISYRTSSAYNPSIWTYTTLYEDDSSATNSYKWVTTNQASAASADTLLEKNEKVEICMKLPAAQPGVNEKINLEIKPPAGATLTISGTLPPAIATTGVFNII